MEHEVTEKQVDPEIQQLVAVVCRTLAYIVKWLKKRYAIDN